LSKDRTTLYIKKNRIITLLNYLAKITKTIIAKRIAYIAKSLIYNKDILNYKQIEDKKQKLSKKFIFNLTYNARIVRNRNDTLSCLLINVKEPFNCISFIQFINILKRLNMLRNIIN